MVSGDEGGEGFPARTKDPFVCLRCGRLILHDDIVCDQCEPTLPPALLKACYDPFDYVLGLYSGKVVRFESASIHGDWVTIESPPEGFPGWFYPCPRGINLRLKDIEWCADAPEGS